MKFGRLREEIKAKFGTLGKFAKAMDIHASTLSLKLNGVVDFSRGEIETIIELLELDASVIPDFFFYN